MKVTTYTRHRLAQRRTDRAWDAILRDLPAHPVEAQAIRIADEIDRGLGSDAYLGVDGRRKVAQALTDFGRALLAEREKGR